MDDDGQVHFQVEDCIECGHCVAVCPTGALTYQGRAVGEMEHQTDIVIRLAKARQSGEWIDPDWVGGEVR